ncbi:MAG: hypothetical protein ACK4SZ_11450 [Allosphingosinicella sp.]|uniref:hypothetical protein n=1 Tax=Allosphingosinicella sp. TaxID=2823234 RepID=UPI003936284B
MGMSLKDELIEIEKGFWLAGVDEARAHLTDEVMLVFKQMKGVYSREQVAQSMSDPNRWQDLRLSDVMVTQPAENLALIGYEARAKRADGQPYRCLAGSTYVRDGDTWKLAMHQHSELEPEAAA